MAVRYFQMSSLEMTRFLGKKFYNIISILNSRIVFTHDKTLMKKFFFDCRQLVSENGFLILELPNFENYSELEKIEFPVRESIRSSLKSVIEKRGEKFYLEQILTNSNDKKLVVTQDAPVYLLKPSEIENFALEAGFSKVELYSDFAENPFTEKSQRVVAVVS